MNTQNPYRVLGTVLTVAGAVLAPVFYFIVGSPPLTATAISSIILGFTCIAIANAQPYLSPAAAQMLLKTGMENTAALLEELGLNNKAIYLPATEGGKATVIIPLQAKFEIQNLKLNTNTNAGNSDEGYENGTRYATMDEPAASSRMVTAEKIIGKGRLIVRFGAAAEEMAIAVTTPGHVSLSLLENKPGPTSDDIVTALNYLLTGVLDIAHGVSVNMADSRVVVTINGAKMSWENVWYYQSLGSPIGSISAAVTAEALGKPIRIVEEKVTDKKSEVIMEPLG